MGNFNETLDQVIFKLILVVDDQGFFCGTALSWRSLDLTENKSAVI